MGSMYDNSSLTSTQASSQLRAINTLAPEEFQSTHVYKHFLGVAAKEEKKNFQQSFCLKIHRKL